MFFFIPSSSFLPDSISLTLSRTSGTSSNDSVYSRTGRRIYAQKLDIAFLDCDKRHGTIVTPAPLPPPKALFDWPADFFVWKSIRLRQTRSLTLEIGIKVIRQAL
jgi:hypothetical protein